MNIIKKSAGIFSKKIHKSYYILDGNKETMRELNETASYIWKLLDKPQTIDSLVSKIMKNFEVDSTLVRKDVVKLVSDFDKLHYITIH